MSDDEYLKKITKEYYDCLSTLLQVAIFYESLLPLRADANEHPAITWAKKLVNK